MCIDYIYATRFRMFLITWIQCDYPKIAVAFDFLLKYITNLLAERLPQNWWSINTKLPQFVHRIANVKGAKEVLKTAGYCIEQHGTLSFPEDKRKVPDRELLSVVSAELLIAKAECERARQGGHELLPSPLVLQQQRGLAKETLLEEEQLHHNLSDLSSQLPHPNQRTDYDKLSHSDHHPEGLQHFSMQPGSHFQPASTPHAEEHQQPVATHPQHDSVAKSSHPEGSLGFPTSPWSSYSDHSVGPGGEQHHQEQIPPSDLTHSSNDRPLSHPRGNLVHDVQLTTELRKQTEQEPFQAPSQLEQAAGEEQAEDEEEPAEDREEQPEDVEDQQDIVGSG